MKQENASLDLFMSGFIDQKLSLFEESIKARLTTVNQPIHTTINIEALNLTKTVTSYVRPELKDTLNLLLDGHITYLVGPSGTGKSYLGSQCAQILALFYRYLNCSLGTNENDLFGRHTPVGFQEGPLWTSIKNGGVFLVDEMDAADESVLLSLNTILALNKGDIAYNKNNGEFSPIHKSFYLIAAGNTKLSGASIAYNTRNKLDDAFVNRFTPLKIGYDENIEKSLGSEFTYELLSNFRLKLKKADCNELITTRDFTKFEKLFQRFGKDKAISIFTTLWSDEALNAIR